MCKPLGSGTNGPKETVGRLVSSACVGYKYSKGVGPSGGLGLDDSGACHSIVAQPC